MKIPRAVSRYVEYELYSYEASKQQLKELREDILAKAERPIELIKIGAEKTKQKGKDNTSTTAIELVTNAAIVRISKRIIEIERALQKLAPHHRQLFRLKYCECKARQQVCREMFIEERTFYKYRRELVAMVAAEMGLIDHAQIMHF